MWLCKYAELPCTSQTLQWSKNWARRDWRSNGVWAKWLRGVACSPTLIFISELTCCLWQLHILEWGKEFYLWLNVFSFLAFFLPIAFNKRQKKPNNVHPHKHVNMERLQHGHLQRGVEGTVRALERSQRLHLGWELKADKVLKALIAPSSGSLPQSSVCLHILFYLISVPSARLGSLQSPSLPLFGAVMKRWFVLFNWRRQPGDLGLSSPLFQDGGDEAVIERCAEGAQD